MFKVCGSRFKDINFLLYFAGGLHQHHEDLNHHEAGLCLDPPHHRGLPTFSRPGHVGGRGALGLLP